LLRSKFFLDKNGTSIVKLDGQFAVDLKGSLPTPCNQPRMVVAPPDPQNRIALEAYSVIDPNRVCNQMVQPFEATITLGKLPQGHYTVWVNGEEIGEIDA
jgi:NADPH-dependent ferric siderophore reductase